jgi:hypothetical protein
LKVNRRFGGTSPASKNKPSKTPAYMVASPGVNWPQTRHLHFVSKFDNGCQGKYITTEAILCLKLIRLAIILQVKQVVLATFVMLVSCLAYSSALKIEATCSSEMSVEFQRTKQRYIPENKTSGIVTLSCLVLSAFNIIKYSGTISCIH